MSIVYEDEWITLRRPDRIRTRHRGRHMMRILTVRQPWAWAIVAGHKTVENRVRNLAGDYRGPVAIHAGLREDTSARTHPEIIRLARDVWWTTPDELLTGRRDQFGHIIGVVDLIDVHHVTWSAHPDRPRAPLCWDGVTPSGEQCSPWAESMHDGWHLVLANPRPLAEPIPYRGALGLRKLEEATTAAVLGGLS